MVTLNHMVSAIGPQQRVKLNENWDIISKSFVNMQRQINILAGEEIDDLLARIASAIDSSETSVVTLLGLITEAETRLGILATATQEANDAAQNADTQASLANVATQEANDARDQALSAISDVRTLLTEFTNKVTTAISNAESATGSANAATQETIAVKEQAEQVILDVNDVTEAARLATVEANKSRDDANTATQDANEIVEALSGYDIPISDFTLSKSYVKHQPVFSNGSSYRAKKNTQNNPLPVLPARENEWWVMEAQKGTDGQGAIRTVNDKEPNMDGNVDVNKNDIGLSNVDNTSDINKPVSTAQQEAINEVLQQNQDLETELSETNGIVEGHVSNGEIHVTKTKKDLWDRYSIQSGILDARGTNKKPDDYRALSTNNLNLGIGNIFREFNDKTSLGFAPAFATVETFIPFSDYTGGVATQIAYCSDGSFLRRNESSYGSNAWNPWVHILSSTNPIVRKEYDLYIGSLNSGLANLTMPAGFANLKSFDEIVVFGVLANSSASTFSRKTTVIPTSFINDIYAESWNQNVLFNAGSAMDAFWMRWTLNFIANNINIDYSRKLVGGVGSDTINDNYIVRIAGVKYA